MYDTVIMQLWEECSDSEFYPDGCSIHINMENRDNYVKNIYSSRIGKPPTKSYEKVISDPIRVNVSLPIYNILEEYRSYRIQQSEMVNLLNFNGIRI